MRQARGQFAVTGWNEETYLEREPGKLTRADVTLDLSGDIVGTSNTVWLMCYREDGTADYVGLQEIEGTVEGRSGAFVVTSVGVFDGERAAGKWTVVAGSSRGDLSGISGNGEFDAPHGSSASFQLSYDL